MGLSGYYEPPPRENASPYLMPTLHPFIGICTFNVNVPLARPNAEDLHNVNKCVLIRSEAPRFPVSKAIWDILVANGTVFSLYLTYECAARTYDRTAPTYVCVVRSLVVPRLVTAT